MSSRDPKADAEGLDSFREAVDDVVPIGDDGRHHHRSPQPAPKPLFLDAGESNEGPAWLDLTTLASMTHYLREGHNPRLLKDLRRGRFRCCSELDLHGMTRHEARDALSHFLQEALDYRERCCCVIVGKGKGSEGEPVLPSLVKSWLIQAETVIAFCEAVQNRGGSGALFILLKIPTVSPRQNRY